MDGDRMVERVFAKKTLAKLLAIYGVAITDSDRNQMHDALAVLLDWRHGVIGDAKAPISS
jgi:hypothetical protein